MTDPNFLHAGAYGCTAIISVQRLIAAVPRRPCTSGAWCHGAEENESGPIDGRVASHRCDFGKSPSSRSEGVQSNVPQLSHFHEDHFDKQVQERLRKDLPIVTTLEAEKPLADLGFSRISGLSTWETAELRNDTFEGDNLNMRVTSTPGKHVAGPVIEQLNDFMAAVPPTTGFILELQWDGRPVDEAAFRVYISGDTLFVKDLEEIPKRFPDIDLMLVHLGGTTIPGPNLPLLMVTMDAKQGIKLVQLIKPKITLPIHYDGEQLVCKPRRCCLSLCADYDVFLSPLSDFQKEMNSAGLADKVVYLDRGERFDFSIRP